MEEKVEKRISLLFIRAHAGTQARAALNPEVIDLYAEAMQNGTKFPPIDVFYDGNVSGTYNLADGFHRYYAAKKAGLEKLLCTIHKGTEKDAEWFSYAANQTNGLYRSTADKQRAIEGALRHPKAAKLTDRALGRYLGVDHKTVGECRKRLSGEIPQMTVRTVVRGGSEYEQNVSNIGKKSEGAPQTVNVVVTSDFPASTSPSQKVILIVEEPAAQKPGNAEWEYIPKSALSEFLEAIRQVASVTDQHRDSIIQDLSTHSRCRALCTGIRCAATKLEEIAGAVTEKVQAAEKATVSAVSG